MDATTIIGYTYEADTHCVDCTKSRFAYNWQFDPWDLDNFDKNDVPFSAMDNEGNLVHPIFCGAEFDYQPNCAECHEIIEGIQLTEDGELAECFA